MNSAPDGSDFECHKKTLRSRVSQRENEGLLVLGSNRLRLIAWQQLAEEVGDGIFVDGQVVDAADVRHGEIECFGREPTKVGAGGVYFAEEPANNEGSHADIT